MSHDPEELRQLLSEMKTDPVNKVINNERRIAISMQGLNLKNLDGIRDKSDCQVSLFMKWKESQNEWQFVDSTEIIYDNLNPRFARQFNVVYNLGQIVKLRFEVDDIDKNSTKTLIGAAELNLATLIQKQGTDFEVVLKNEKISKPGSLVLKSSEKSEAKHIVKLDL